MRMLRDAETNEAISEATAEQVDASDFTDGGIIEIDGDGDVVTRRIGRHGDTNPQFTAPYRSVYVEE